MGKGAGRPFALARCWEINDRPPWGPGPAPVPYGVKDLVAARPLAEPLAVVRCVTYGCPKDRLKMYDRGGTTAPHKMLSIMWEQLEGF